MVVHSGQVEPLEADACHSILNLLRPQLRGLLLLLYQPGKRREEAAGGRHSLRVTSSLSDSCGEYLAGWCLNSNQSVQLKLKRQA